MNDEERGQAAEANDIQQHIERLIRRVTQSMQAGATDRTAAVLQRPRKRVRSSSPSQGVKQEPDEVTARPAKMLKVMNKSGPKTIDDMLVSITKTPSELAHPRSPGAENSATTTQKPSATGKPQATDPSSAELTAFLHATGKTKADFVPLFRYVKARGIPWEEVERFLEK